MCVSNNFNKRGGHLGHSWYDIKEIVKHTIKWKRGNNNHCNLLNVKQGDWTKLLKKFKYSLDMVLTFWSSIRYLIFVKKKNKICQSMNVHCPYSVLTFGIINLRVWKYCSFWSPHCSCQKQEIVKHYIIFHYKSKIRVRVGLVGRSFLFVCLFVCCLISANNCT